MILSLSEPFSKFVEGKLSPVKKNDHSYRLLLLKRCEKIMYFTLVLYQKNKTSFSAK